MRVRRHKGFGHGLEPGMNQDINCPICQREKLAGIVPDITEPVAVNAQTGRRVTAAEVDPTELLPGDVVLSLSIRDIIGLRVTVERET